MIACGKIRYQRGAVEIDSKVEIAFAARCDAADCSDGFHAAEDGFVVGQAVCIGMYIDTGVAEVAIVFDQFGQKGDFRCRACFADCKPYAQTAVLIDARQNIANPFQTGF